MIMKRWPARERLLLSFCVAILVAAEASSDTSPGGSRGEGPRRSDHWSLQPIREPALPTVRDPAILIHNPIDLFVAAKLEANELAPSRPAEPFILARRLSLDLTGLPPTPDEVTAFVASGPGYERFVDRWLASPRYGERWARHWLDVARYSESQGFEYDRLRDNAWHYRDYVIASFNADKPYDLFMKEQVAGDVLEPVTAEGIVGASLLICGAWDEAGNNQANATQKAITREEELEDLISVVSQTFLGLTVHCARCHDHKFDPIPQSDYFRIQSVFAGVKHGERAIPMDAIPSRWAVAATGAVTYAGTRVQPAPTRRLRRGDVTQPAEVMTPGTLAALVDLNPDFGLAADAPEAQRRLKFAEWLADPANPLPARVMANRVWHLHFGQGLVATPGDFGASGARPTHPELLDWLALRLIESGWSVKALHRLILTSATYRQASTIPEGSRAMKVDAGNELLWRFPVRRLEAEPLRDAMLFVSGQINLESGGPGFRPFEILKFPANAYAPADLQGAAYNRRTVYRMNVNSGKDPLLDAFDCPDPSVKTPRRGVTTTPLQALGLMNNSFVLRQAKQLAASVLNEAGGDEYRAITVAYRRTLSRTPTEAESRRALAAAGTGGVERVCWALLNSTEFVYVR